MCDVHVGKCFTNVCRMFWQGVLPCKFANFKVQNDECHYYAIDPFHLSICLWVKRCDKWYPTFRNKCFQKLIMNFASWSLLTKNWSIPWSFTHMLNFFVISMVVMVILVDTILANFKNQLTITNMASIPFHYGSWIMKSMEALSHGSLGIGKGWYNPNFFS